MPPEIVLVTSVDVQYIIDHRSLFDNATLVALDYTSYNAMSLAKIDHLVLDDFLSYNDYGRIDEFAHKLPLIWPAISNSTALMHESINLGYVIEWELIFALVKFLRLFLGIHTIVSKLKPETVSVHAKYDSVHRIAKLVSEEKRCRLKLIDVGDYSEKGRSLFWLDNISITLDVAGKPITVVLPRQVYHKIKNSIDLAGRMLAIFTSRKSAASHGEDEPSVLLLDFNLVNYKPLMSALKDTQTNALLINQRRPIIWNIASLRIFRELGFSYNSLGQYSNRSLEKSIKDKVKEINSFFDNLQETNNEFSNIFSFDGYSFWAAFKNDFASFCKTRLAEAVREASLGNQVLKTKRIKSLLVWSDHAQFEKTMVLLAKSHGIPTFVIQHGVFGNILRKDQTVWASQDNKRVYADYFCCWGKITKDWLVKSGIEEKRLILTGSPRYDSYFSNSLYNNYESGNILLATSGIPSNTFSIFSSVRCIEEYEKGIRSVCRAARSFPDKRFVVKLHPYADEGFDIVKVILEENPQANIIKNAGIVETIKNSDIVISTGSSVLLEAMILHKPTIMLRYISGVEQQEISYSEFGASVGVDGNEESLKKAISEILNDKDLKEKLVARGQDYINGYLEFQGNSSHRLSQVIIESDKMGIHDLKRKK